MGTRENPSISVISSSAAAARATWNSRRRDNRDRPCARSFRVMVRAFEGQRHQTRRRILAQEAVRRNVFRTARIATPRDSRVPVQKSPVPPFVVHVVSDDVRSYEWLTVTSFSVFFFYFGQCTISFSPEMSIIVPRLVTFARSTRPARLFGFSREKAGDFESLCTAHRVSLSLSLFLTRQGDTTLLRW